LPAGYEFGGGVRLGRGSERPMTVAEMARTGGVARAKASSKAELRKWGQARPPAIEDGLEGTCKVEGLLADGSNQAECAAARRESGDHP
jgi:hypothetical protein